jgi:preprotein translocase subunit YajC
VHTSVTVLAHVLAASTPSSPSSSGKGGSFAPFLVLLGLFALAYFVFIRPARNRQRAQLAERRSVNVGDEITTTAGLIATVVAVDDDYLTLEVAPGVHCRYVHAAVLRVNTLDDDDEPDTLDDDDDENAAEATSAAPDPSTHEVIEQPPPAVEPPVATPEPPVTPTEPTDGTEGDSPWHRR